MRISFTLSRGLSTCVLCFAPAHFANARRAHFILSLLLLYKSHAIRVGMASGKLHSDRQTNEYSLDAADNARFNSKLLWWIIVWNILAKKEKRINYASVRYGCRDCLLPLATQCACVETFKRRAFMILTRNRATATATAAVFTWCAPLFSATKRSAFLLAKLTDNETTSRFPNETEGDQKKKKQSQYVHRSKLPNCRNWITGEQKKIRQGRREKTKKTRIVKIGSTPPPIWS